MSLKHVIITPKGQPPKGSIYVKIKGEAVYLTKEEASQLIDNIKIQLEIPDIYHG